MLLEIAGAVLAAFLAVVIYGLRPLQHWKLRHLKGPKSSWLFGNARTVMSLGQPKAYQKWSAQFGPSPFAVHLLSSTFVVIPSTEDARQILLHTNGRPDVGDASLMPKFIRDDAASSIFWSRQALLAGSLGLRWKSLRSIWQPVFFTGSLEGYMPLTIKAANFLADDLAEAERKREYINIQSIVQDMTLNVIGRTAFGVDLHTQASDKTKLPADERERSRATREAAEKMFSSQSNSPWILAGLAFPFLLPIIRSLCFKFPDKSLVALLHARLDVMKTSVGLVRSHKESLKDQPTASNKEDQSVSSAAGGAFHGTSDVNVAAEKASGKKEMLKGVKPGSFVDLLVKGNNRATGRKFPDNELAQQASTMILVGYETTANLLTFAFYLLSQSCNLDKQEKLIAEVDSLGSDYDPTFADLETKLPYMEAVLKESLRLFPPVHTIIRMAENDITLSGKKIQRGQWLAIPVFHIHNDPGLWGPDSDKFRPERWLTEDEEALKKARSNFFAFGDGARVCPGYRFAMHEAKITLLKVFQRFSLELGPHQEPLELRSEITMSAKNGVLVKPSARNFKG